MSSVSLQACVATINDWLQTHEFKDYCPNGLQLEGKAEIKKLVSGVTACEALIDKAIAVKADAILVHHGYFWKGETTPIVGMKKRRIAKLLAADISLLAYHLPLDTHPKMGNNIQLAHRLGLLVDGGLQPESKHPVGLVGSLEKSQSIAEWSSLIARQLGREPLVISHDVEQPVKRVAWCTGAAQSYIEQAIEQGADVFLSGEISEPTVHIAREAGITYIAAGHHATERYGVQALGERLQQHFGIEHCYIDIDNPV